MGSFGPGAILIKNIPSLVRTDGCLVFWLVFALVIYISEAVRYFDTQIYRYSDTQIHDTEIQSCKGAQIHRYTDT